MKKRLRAPILSSQYRYDWKYQNQKVLILKIWKNKYRFCSVGSSTIENTETKNTNAGIDFIQSTEKMKKLTPIPTLFCSFCIGTITIKNTYRSQKYEKATTVPTCHLSCQHPHDQKYQNQKVPIPILFSR